MGSARVLYVEGDDMLRATVTEVLQEDGYAVTGLATGAAAVRTLREASEGELPEVCVVDAADDGEVVEELQADRYARVAVVTLSYGLEPQPRADVDVRGPYSLRDLEHAVEVALERVGRSAPARPGGGPGAD